MPSAGTWRGHTAWPHGRTRAAVPPSGVWRLCSAPSIVLVDAWCHGRYNRNVENCARWRSASPAALGEGAAWGRTVRIRRLQSTFQAAPPIRQFNPSRVIPFKSGLVVSIDPPGSPESSHSTTGRCPGLRYTSEVGGVRLPMWPGLRPIVYKVLSSNKVRPGTRLTGFLQLSYSRLTPSYLPRRS